MVVVFFSIKMRARVERITLLTYKGSIYYGKKYTQLCVVFSIDTWTLTSSPRLFRGSK